LRELRGCRCVVNGADSNTGWNLFRAAVAALEVKGPFFSEVRIVGSHASSLAEVAARRADVAAIDCVTHAYLSRFSRGIVARTRIVGVTAASPALPVITGGGRPDAVVGALTSALSTVADDPDLATTRDTLGLTGFVPATRATYDVVRNLERFAIDRGYPRLL
jgi:ABC-type phosphate/phosphonate transport system substrate-binding protein